MTTHAGINTVMGVIGVNTKVHGKIKIALLDYLCYFILFLILSRLLIYVEELKVWTGNMSLAKD